MRKTVRLFALAEGALLAFGCGGGQKANPPVTITVTSPAFADHADIPMRYTCEGDDASPALAWSGVPDKARSLALIVDDPDAPDPAAPRTVWVHWILYDIPTNVHGLPENAGRAGVHAPGREGVNDWKRTGWGGPCPPIGKHRYFFRLFALDIMLADLARPNRAQLERAMKGHVLAQGELVGLYQKQR